MPHTNPNTPKADAGQNSVQKADASREKASRKGVRHWDGTLRRVPPTVLSLNPFDGMDR